ncbi:hypothetical protein RRF57_008772 [Xylaria bambusicola]|uniref:Uncharacterized protein n=1 Tax=Xylaria bambusicola TaxID=326684 RepID=A0AAN7UNL3_9PEZI
MSTQAGGAEVWDLDKKPHALSLGAHADIQSEWNYTSSLNTDLLSETDVGLSCTGPPAAPAAAALRVSMGLGLTPLKLRLLGSAASSNGLRCAPSPLVVGTSRPLWPRGLGLRPLCSSIPSPARFI